MNRISYVTEEETQLLIKFFKGQMEKCGKQGDDWGEFINGQQLEDCEMWLETLKRRKK